MRQASSMATTSMVVLGILAAVGLVSIGLIGNHKAQRTELMSVGVRARQARAIAEGFSRGVKLSTTQMLDEEVAADADADAEAENATNATNSTPCVSWRGCRHQSDPEVPDDIHFECGGPVNGDICYQSVNSCVESAETSLANMYKVSAILATESRTSSVCTCFVSNGCKPACNVALYQRWSTHSAINCPSTPPIYHKSTGVYQYGNTDADYVSPSDLSFEYFPQFPNPSGHTYNTHAIRRTYEEEPAIGYYQRPLLANYKSGYTDIPDKYSLGRFDSIDRMYTPTDIVE